MCSDSITPPNLDGLMQFVLVLPSWLHPSLGVLSETLVSAMGILNNSVIIKDEGRCGSNDSSKFTPLG